MFDQSIVLSLQTRVEVHLHKVQFELADVLFDYHLHELLVRSDFELHFFLQVIGFCHLFGVSKDPSEDLAFGVYTNSYKKDGSGHHIVFMTDLRACSR